MEAGRLFLRCIRCRSAEAGGGEEPTFPLEVGSPGGQVAVRVHHRQEHPLEAEHRSILKQGHLYLTHPCIQLLFGFPPVLKFNNKLLNGNHKDMNVYFYENSELVVPV